MAQPARFSRPAPGALVVGLLPVEGLLWLSERFRWFEFNRHQGWTVFIGASVVAGTMLLLVLWWRAAFVLGWRFQLSMRSLLLLVVVIALPCSWLAAELQAARRRQQALPRCRMEY